MSCGQFPKIYWCCTFVFKVVDEFLLKPYHYFMSPRFAGKRWMRIYLGP